MQISQLKTNSRLVKKTISEPQIVAKYGEAIDYYVMEPTPFDFIVKVLKALDNKDTESLVLAISSEIRQEDGSKLLSAGESLPLDVMGVIIEAFAQDIQKGSVENEAVRQDRPKIRSNPRKRRQS
jgi:hypothetical protein